MKYQDLITRVSRGVGQKFTSDEIDDYKIAIHWAESQLFQESGVERLLDSDSFTDADNAWELGVEAIDIHRVIFCDTSSGQDVPFFARQIDHAELLEYSVQTAVSLSQNDIYPIDYENTWRNFTYRSAIYFSIFMNEDKELTIQWKPQLNNLKIYVWYVVDDPYALITPITAIPYPDYIASYVVAGAIQYLALQKAAETAETPDASLVFMRIASSMEKVFEKGKKRVTSYGRPHSDNPVIMPFNWYHDRTRR
jgi:hypothetical protein